MSPLKLSLLLLIIKREGDTFIHHILQDFKYVEKAYIEKDEAKIQSCYNYPEKKALIF